MKQHHPLLRRMLCAALALAVACMGTPALAKSIPALDPEMTVNSSHAIYYGSEASLADGVYGAQEGAGSTCRRLPTARTTMSYSP